MEIVLADLVMVAGDAIGPDLSDEAAYTVRAEMGTAAAILGHPELIRR